MRSETILLALIAQAHAEDVLDMLGNNFVDSVQGPMEVDKLFERELKAAPLHAALDNTTHGKASNLAISSQSVQAPMFSAHAFFGNPTTHFRKEAALSSQSPAFFYSCPRSCPTDARGSTRVHAQDADKAEFDKMVSENRMISFQESNVRYAAAGALFTALAVKYAGMQSSGQFDYGTIAGLSAGAYLLFQTGRQSL